MFVEDREDQDETHSPQPRKRRGRRNKKKGQDSDELRISRTKELTVYEEVRWDIGVGNLLPRSLSQQFSNNRQSEENKEFIRKGHRHFFSKQDADEKENLGFQSPVRTVRFQDVRSPSTLGLGERHKDALKKRELKLADKEQLKLEKSKELGLIPEPPMHSPSVNYIDFTSWAISFSDLAKFFTKLKSPDVLDLPRFKNVEVKTDNRGDIVKLLYRNKNGSIVPPGPKTKPDIIYDELGEPLFYHVEVVLPARHRGYSFNWNEKNLNRGWILKPEHLEIVLDAKGDSSVKNRKPSWKKIQDFGPVEDEDAEGEYYGEKYEITHPNIFLLRDRIEKEVRIGKKIEKEEMAMPNFRSMLVNGTVKAVKADSVAIITGCISEFKTEGEDIGAKHDHHGAHRDELQKHKTPIFRRTHKLQLIRTKEHGWVLGSHLCVTARYDIPRPAKCGQISNVKPNKCLVVWHSSWKEPLELLIETTTKVWEIKKIIQEKITAANYRLARRLAYEAAQSPKGGKSSSPTNKVDRSDMRNLPLSDWYLAMEAFDDDMVKSLTQKVGEENATFAQTRKIEIFDRRIPQNLRVLFNGVASLDDYEVSCRATLHIVEKGQKLEWSKRSVFDIDKNESRGNHNKGLSVKELEEAWNLGLKETNEGDDEFDEDLKEAIRWQTSKEMVFYKTMGWVQAQEELLMFLGGWDYDEISDYKNFLLTGLRQDVAKGIFFGVFPNKEEQKGHVISPTRGSRGSAGSYGFPARAGSAFSENPFQREHMLLKKSDKKSEHISSLFDEVCINKNIRSKSDLKEMKFEVPNFQVDLVDLIAKLNQGCERVLQGVEESPDRPEIKFAGELQELYAERWYALINRGKKELLKIAMTDDRDLHVYNAVFKTERKRRGASPRSARSASVRNGNMRSGRVRPRLLESHECVIDAKKRLLEPTEYRKHNKRLQKLRAALRKVDERHIFESLHNSEYTEILRMAREEEGAFFAKIGAYWDKMAPIKESKGHFMLRNMDLRQKAVQKHFTDKELEAAEMKSKRIIKLKDMLANRSFAQRFAEKTPAGIKIVEDALAEKSAREAVNHAIQALRFYYELFEKYHNEEAVDGYLNVYEQFKDPLGWIEELLRVPGMTDRSAIFSDIYDQFITMKMFVEFGRHLSDEVYATSSEMGK